MKLNTPIFAALLISVSVSSAWATDIPPASSQAVTIVPTFFGGTLLDTAITQVSTPSYTGWARTAVYDSGTGLDFYYQFSNDATSRSGIERLTAFDYGTFTVDAYQTTAAFGIFVPGTENIDTVDRGTLGVIGFNFLPTGTTKIEPGKSSFTGILRTNAHHYTTGSFGIIDGYAANAVGFAPAVPEPETYAMMLLGIGILGWVRRNKSQQARLWNDASSK
ncbi:MAG: hypothetical protein RL748_1484 [Pseudomonadota bacterium]